MAVGLSFILAFSGCGQSGPATAPSQQGETAGQPGTGQAGGESQASAQTGESQASGQTGESSGTPAGETSPEQAGNIKPGEAVSPEKAMGRFTVLQEYEDGDWSEVTFAMNRGAGGYSADEKAAATVPKLRAEEYPEVDGSTATLPLSRALYSASTGASEAEAEKTIMHQKTTQSYYNLMYGYTDLVIAYRAPESFYEDMEKEGTELLIEPIGRDALVFMRNETNPVESLTGQELKDIYQGKVKNWKELGGEDKEIVAFQRPSGSGSQTLMENLVMQGDKMADAPSDWVLSEMGELLERTASYNNSHNALGYSVYYYAKNMYEIPGLGFMAVDGVMPENKSIRTGDYPYVNDFYAAIRKDEPQGSPARQLFEWLQGEDGQAFIESLGYVAAKEVPESADKEAEPSAGKAFDGHLELPEDKAVFLSARILLGTEGAVLIRDSAEEMTFIRDYAVDFEEVVTDISRPSIVTKNSPDENNPEVSGVRDIPGKKWVLEPAPGSIEKVQGKVFRRRSSEKTEYYDRDWKHIFDIPNPGDRDGEGWEPGQILAETPNYIWNFDYINRVVEIYDYQGNKQKTLGMEIFGKDPWPESVYRPYEEENAAEYGTSIPILRDLDDYTSGHVVYRENGEEGFSADQVSSRVLSELGASAEELDIDGVMDGDRIYEITVRRGTSDDISVLYDAVKGVLLSTPEEHCMCAADVSHVMDSEYKDKYLVLPDGTIPETPDGKYYTSVTQKVLWRADGGGISVREEDGREFVIHGNYDQSSFYKNDGCYILGWSDDAGNSYEQVYRDGKVIWSGSENQSYAGYDEATDVLEYWDRDAGRYIHLDKDGKEIEEDPGWDPYWTDWNREYGISIGYFADHVEVRDAKGRTVVSFTEEDSD